MILNFPVTSCPLWLFALGGPPPVPSCRVKLQNEAAMNQIPIERKLALTTEPAHYFQNSLFGSSCLSSIWLSFLAQNFQNPPGTDSSKPYYWRPAQWSLLWQDALRTSPLVTSAKSAARLHEWETDRRSPSSFETVASHLIGVIHFWCHLQEI